MGRYFIEITPDAKKDLKQHYKSGNKATLKKLKRYFLNLLKRLFRAKVSRKNLNTILMVIGQGV